MDKRYYNSGFTLVEMCICLALLCSLMVLTLPMIQLPNLGHYQFANEYLEFQSQSISERLNEEFISNVEANYDYPIRFNENGNVRRAQTITFSHINSLRLVSQLGGGRLEYK